MVVEFALGVLDDRRDTAEMFLQHDAAMRKNDPRKIVDRTIRRHLRGLARLTRKDIAIMPPAHVHDWSPSD